ncbi:PP2C-family Ser/Thr phosphatase [Mycobacterium talmoniae]|uniref:PP2C-family Ser/Thr phosphatase n=1 Tax=Mycobacterium talmoniae TaxID=1858794 RepID=A0A2S8BJC0_9MYCO|nr:PP2C-family Ser/Thr phosphatase [Mycobacterium talmoniae]
MVGDRYLLCSDGLSDPVSDEAIAEALQIPDLTASADRLIELALRGGGLDNVTVVVADVIDHDDNAVPELDT